MQTPPSFPPKEVSNERNQIVPRARKAFGVRCQWVLAAPLELVELTDVSSEWEPSYDSALFQILPPTAKGPRQGMPVFQALQNILVGCGFEVVFSVSVHCYSGFIVPIFGAIHRSAWKRSSANFACTGFSEVRQEGSSKDTPPGTYTCCVLTATLRVLYSKRGGGV